MLSPVSGISITLDSTVMAGRGRKKCLSKWLDFSKGFIAVLCNVHNRHKGYYLELFLFKPRLLLVNQDSHNSASYSNLLRLIIEL